jgi:hypothetical protein
VHSPSVIFYWWTILELNQIDLCQATMHSPYQLKSFLIKNNLLGKAIEVSCFFVALCCFVISIMVKKFNVIRLFHQVIITFFSAYGG